MSSNYYYQTRNGKRVRVRKNRSIVSRKDLETGINAAATSSGFVLGTGAGVSVARAISKNPILKTATMSLGAIAGATAGGVLSSRAIEKSRRNR